MNKESAILWLKYSAGATLLFVVGGIPLNMYVEGLTFSQTIALLLDIGWMQSLFYGVIVGAALVVGKG